ncbi:MAG TPA: class I SAM-dependent methyltransferase [Polyangia bacterium]
MSEERAAEIRTFVDDYRRVRLAEGFASTDPEFARRLPFRDTTGRNARAWRARAVHYLALRAVLAVLPRVDRVLDVGAGNGWMARRLAGSFRVTALDVDATDTGLGAIEDPRVGRLRADLEALPVAAARVDVAIVAAALHYALDVTRALGELARVLRPGGLLVVADSPVYPDAAARDAAWERTRDHYRFSGAGHLAARYRGLVREELDGRAGFRFVELGLRSASPRAWIGRLRGQPVGARFPLLCSRKT